jgi:galactoside O-acetyltransferase
VNSFLEKDEIESLKFANLGENVFISRHALILGAKNISISNNVRIDPFTVLSAKNGKLNIGDFVHIGSHSLLICSGGIEIDDFASISSNVQIFSGSDDFSGNFLTNPTVDSKFVTPQAEGLQALIWHLIVSHPLLARSVAKWEGLDNRTTI